jgi:hypothetical protein
MTRLVAKAFLICFVEVAANRRVRTVLSDMASYMYVAILLTHIMTTEVVFARKRRGLKRGRGVMGGQKST